MKKNDRVMWTDGNKILHGTVIRVGKRISVIQDGGEYKVTGIPSIFSPSNKLLPKDPPSPMDDYRVTNYKEHKELSEETNAYTAIIHYKGIPILSARNTGCGGSTEIHPLTGITSEDLGKFWADAKAWVIQFGQTSPFETYEDWIDWYIHKRPYAVSAREYNEDVERRMGASRAKFPAPHVTK